MINLQVRYYSNKSVVSCHSQHVFTAETIIVFINKNMFKKNICNIVSIGFYQIWNNFIHWPIHKSVI